jgi:putative ABC transport system permease protein
VRSGITWQALRRHRWTLAGPLATQTVAGMVISAMVMTARSIDKAPLTALERVSPILVNMVDATTVFIGVAVYMTMLVVGVTMAMAMAGQLREIALLRTIGASPGQVRRSAVLQAAIVAVPASIVGFALAIPAGTLWVTLLRDHRVMPDRVSFRPSLVALPVAVGVVLATSMAGTFVAAMRTSRLRPAEASTEIATGRRRIRRTRTTIGLALMVGGAVLSAVLSLFAQDQAADAAFFVMLAECIGVGMVGPHVLRAVSRLLHPFAGDGLVRVALDDIASMTRSLSGALVPLVLATAFAIVKIATHTTAAHVTGVADPAMDRWTDYSGTAVYCAFAGVAALNCFVTVLVSRRRDLAAMQLAGATRQALVRIVGIEASIVTVVAVGIAAVVSTTTLAPMLHTSLGVWLPRLPPTVVAAGVVLVAVVVTAGMVAPAAVISRRPPIENTGLAA